MYSAEEGNKELKISYTKYFNPEHYKKNKQTFDQVKHELAYLTVFKMFNSKTIFDDVKK